VKRGGLGGGKRKKRFRQPVSDDISTWGDQPWEGKKFAKKGTGSGDVGRKHCDPEGGGRRLAEREERLKKGTEKNWEKRSKKNLGDNGRRQWTRECPVQSESTPERLDKKSQKRGKEGQA